MCIDICCQVNFPLQCWLQTDLMKFIVFIAIIFVVVEGVVVLIFSMRQCCPINWISLLLNWICCRPLWANKLNNDRLSSECRIVNIDLKISCIQSWNRNGCKKSFCYVRTSWKVWSSWKVTWQIWARCNYYQDRDQGQDHDHHHCHLKEQLTGRSLHKSQSQLSSPELKLRTVKLPVNNDIILLTCYHHFFFLSLFFY